MHGTDALEDQGPELRLTDLRQAQVGSQRGRPTRVGMLTVKMQWFERGLVQPELARSVAILCITFLALLMRSI